MDGCPTITLDCILVLSVVVVSAAISDNNADSYKRVDDTGINKGAHREFHRHHRLSERLSLVENYLIKFGYLDNERHVPRKERRHAILSFQHYNGLHETGKLNRRTVHKMAEPRCGVPDDVHPEVKKRKKRQAPYGPSSWRQKIITWRPASYSRKIPIYQQWRTLTRAFQTWERVIPKHFKYTRSRPDIVVKFARGIHGDGDYNGFDGRGMTLAHAFPPGQLPISGDTHFDDDEDWSKEGKGTATSPDLLAVATHEFGHAIGLAHSANYNSIMSPFFAANKTELTESDIRAAQIIYGSIPRVRDNSVTGRTSNEVTASTTPKPRSRYRPRTTTVPHSNNHGRNTTPKPRSRYRPRTTTVPPRPTLTKLPRCQGIDATFIGQDGFVSVIANDTLFQVDRRSRSRKSLPLRSIYPNAPLPVGAAAYVKGRLYLFKDSHVWRYTKYKLDFGFPKKVLTHEKGEYPRAAISIKGYRNRRIYLFGKTKFWEWSLWDDEVTGRKQYDVTQFWKGVPTSPDAAVTWADQAIYFVKKDMYYKVSQRTRRLSRRFPKRMPAPWMRDMCIND